MDSNGENATASNSPSKVTSVPESSTSSTSTGPGRSTSPPTKRKKPNLSDLELNRNLLKPDVLEQLRTAWESGSNFENPDLVGLFSKPFTHVEIPNFIQDSNFMTCIQEILSDGTIFQEKASDLFSFQQSDDLRSIDLKEVEIIR